MTIQDNTWYWSEFFWTKQTLFGQLAKLEVCALDDNNKFMLKFSIWGPQCCCSLWGNCPCCYCCSVTHFSSVQSLSCVWLSATPWIAARQDSLSITNSRSSLKFTSIESVMPSSHLILCRPLFLLPSIPPSIRVFSNESTLHMMWPKYWSFSFSIIPSKEHQDWPLLEWTGWISLQSKLSPL